MKYVKRLTKKFHLHYPDKRMEQEYDLIQTKNINDNTQLTLYAVFLLLLIPFIPALVDGHYIDAGITVAAMVLMLLINFSKVIPKHYVVFLIAIVICTFNYCLFFLPSFSIDTTSKGLMFIRGYGFASINVCLLTRFAYLWQKIVFLMYSFAFRWILFCLLDPNTLQVYTLIRHVLIDIFIVYTSFLDEKNRRLIFRKFYEYREELMKFKELLANYLPQSIAILGDCIQKTLFANKSFSESFCNTENETKFDTIASIPLPSPRPQLKNLEIDTSSIRAIGANSLELNFLHKTESFEKVHEELNCQKILDTKAVSLSASCSLQDDYKSYEVILMKIKWDTEDAVAVILNDTTHQENLIRLKMSDANKDRIIATISHELRTPLNGILGILEIARKRIEDKQALEYLELCKDNAHLLLNLVNSLLDLHQIRQGKLRTNPAVLEVKRVLEDITKLFSFQCNQKGITLKFHIGDNAPKHICTDENRFKQILINLIGNSIKFTSKGGITVEVDQDQEKNDYLLISVSDTGIGIKEEDKGKLFQMYEKIEHGQSVNRNGVGLGLTISNTLAGILSGKNEERVIKVTSEVDKGSKFTFKILRNLEQKDEEDDQHPIAPLKISESNSLEELNSEEEFQTANRNENKVLSPINISKQLKSHSFLPKFPSGFLIERSQGSNHQISAYSSTEPQDTQKSPPSKTSKPRREHKGDILAVDDNPFNLLVAQNIVEVTGYTLKMAQSGHEAIEIMRFRNKDEVPFKAILMDCQMPVMDGFETTRVLREMMEKGEVQDVPIIALTANNAEEDIKRCYESGMVGHLSKPLFAVALEKSLSKLGK